jgi:hypothetical protein
MGYNAVSPVESQPMFRIVLLAACFMVGFLVWLILRS